MSSDFARLRLKYHGDPVKMEEILQAECREKGAMKFPKLITVQNFIFPSLSVTEMATSEAIAEIHASMVPEGSRVLDMTAGLGVDAIAMATRGSRVTAIEIDSRTASVLRQNVETLGLSESVTVIEGDSTEWLKNNYDTFDVIYIDPARRDSAGRHFTLRNCHPDVISLMPLLMERGRKIIVKASPMLNADSLSEFGADPVVTGTASECKELLFILPGSGSDNVRCVTAGHGEYTVRPHIRVSYGVPKPGEILLQPFPAVMKGGGNVVMDGVKKLSPFSHLYFSAEPHQAFPGEAYGIIEIVPFNKRGIKEVSERYPEINVAVRNFPLRAPELVKKLGIKEGGDLMLFGTTGSDGEKMTIICKKLKTLTI
ncbi:MAG: class I SAM-dependent methyltransferase [Muribaculaceae bacterium]|nr:class I SAM-dependent methyltransferase [Muribaculaceae bacterium]